ncbi:MAG: serine/threonine-protein kinase [Kofleriaceae bacterium]
MARRDDPDATRIALLDPLIGQTIAKDYRIELGIAAGGFGAIYRGVHLPSELDVAIKVLHPNLTQSDAVRARFQREAEVLAALRDPHTVKIYTTGETDEGMLYIVMELLSGENLYETYKQLGPLPWRRVVQIARDVCSSLSEAHAQGIIHRDLKPANIHLLENGDVKVLDFGIAKIIRGNTDIDNSDLTQAGHMIGTFDYMPPEQMIGGECTGLVDMFTLGVVMYETIAGARPFGEHDTSTQMLAALLSQKPKPLGAYAEVPPELDKIILRCIQRKPEQRYASIDDLAIELDTLLVVEEDATRSSQAVMARPTDNMNAITPPANIEDVAITPTAFEDVAATPVSITHIEEGATQFTPPPIFVEPEPEVTMKQPKPKFVQAKTLPGIIAPKKK